MLIYNFIQTLPESKEHIIQIFVEKIITKNADVNVFFSSKYGKAFAMWEKGSIPSINATYDVEIDTKNLIWGYNITENTICESFIKMNNNFILIGGILDSVDDDGFTVLRLSENIVTFIATGKAFEVGKPIILRLDEIVLYPTG